MLGALIKQGLVDSDEIVITSALECFIRLIKEFFNIRILSSAPRRILPGDPGLPRRRQPRQLSRRHPQPWAGVYPRVQVQVLLQEVKLNLVHQQECC